MTRSPKGLIANRSVTPEEMAQVMGTRSAYYGCPDTRQEIILGRTLPQLLEAREVTKAALAGFLATVKSNYEVLGCVPDEYQGARNVPIPIEVMSLIAEKLVDKALWSKKCNAAQTEAARKQDAKWQAEADAVWRKRPKLSLTAVAKRIAPKNWNYVRQRISKPAK
jgi:hypothetical protein